MEIKNTSPVNYHLLPSSLDEIFMQRSLIFSENLKDLRSIRNQLYSAAKFFEDSYHKNDHDQLLLESLKDYVSKALINTIDHLGSVTSKVNKFLDQNVNEVFETNLQALCIEQKLRTCEAYSDYEGFLQQSLMIQTPKYHKQYLLPDGRFSKAIQAEKANVESSSLRKGHAEQASTKFSSGPVAFSFTKADLKKGPEKRSRSTSPSGFRIKSFGSASSPSTSPSFPVMRFGSVVHRSFSPNTCSSRQQHPPEALRSHSFHPERERRKDNEAYSKKTKNLFKALLSIHKNKNNGGPYR